MPAFAPTSGVRQITSTTPNSVTGTTANTLLGLANIPASWVTTGSVIEITAFWAATNNANNKTPMILLAEAGNGLSGATYFYNAAFSGWGSLHTKSVLLIQSPIRQLGGLLNSVGGTGSVTTGPVVLTRNIEAGLDLMFSAQLATSSDYVTLEGYTVEVRR